MVRYMSDLQANVKSTLITEIKKTTQPLVSQVTSLEGKLESYEARVVALDSKVDTLERKVESLERELECCQVQKARMELCIDDSEQYSHRSCLRLTGVPLPHDKKETAMECLEKVKRVLGKLEVQLMNECIDRAHRIGPIKEIKDDNGSSTVQQPIILKFTTWSTRMAVYRAWKKLNGPRIF